MALKQGTPVKSLACFNCDRSRNQALSWGLEMARLARFERATFPLGGERSIQLSYKRMMQ